MSFACLRINPAAAAVPRVSTVLVGVSEDTCFASSGLGALLIVSTKLMSVSVFPCVDPKKQKIILE